MGCIVECGKEKPISSFSFVSMNMHNDNKPKQQMKDRENEIEIEMEKTTTIEKRLLYDMLFGCTLGEKETRRKRMCSKIRILAV